MSFVKHFSKELNLILECLFSKFRYRVFCMVYDFGDGAMPETVEFDTSFKKTHIVLTLGCNNEISVYTINFRIHYTFPCIAYTLYNQEYLYLLYVYSSS